VSTVEPYPVLRGVLTGQPIEGCVHLGPSPEPHGWAAEFGVWSGTSLRIIAGHMPVIGFDSFEGLPEDWRKGFPRGMFDYGSTDLPHPPDGRAMIVPGWFEDTTPGFPFPPLGLVHIDCDLYSSTVTALNAVLPHIGPGTIIVFDEFHGYPGWEKHEAKAWREFCDQHRVVYNTVARGDQERAIVISAIGAR
jgi:hypothetical protein